jgi:hypothetical protein
LTATGVEVEPQAYEERLFEALLRQQEHLAQGLLLTRTPESFREAVRVLEEVLAADPSREGRLSTAYPLAEAYVGLGLGTRAEPLLRKVLTLSPPPGVEARSAQLLGDICASTGRPGEALAWRNRAQILLRTTPGVR